MIHVSVCSASGDVLALELNETTSLGELKEAIAEKWLAPALCQKLLFGTEIMPDPVHLSELQNSCALSLTMLLSLDTIIECLDRESQFELSDNNQFVAARALAALAQLWSRGDQHAISLLQERIDNPASRIQAQAIAALRSNLNEGDELAVTTLCRCLSSRNPQSRQSALSALSSCVKKGDKFAIAAVSDHLADEDNEVRQAAVLVLSEIVEQGNIDVICRLKTCLGDPDPSVREVALLALKRIANTGDESIIEAASLCLADPDSSARFAAQNLIRSLQEPSEHLAASQSLTIHLG